MAKKYELTGTTEEGDTWTFATDDKARAVEMLTQMKQDFDEVEMREGGKSVEA